MGKKHTYIPSQTEDKKNKEQGLVRFLHERSMRIKKEHEEREIERKRKTIEEDILRQSEIIEKKAEKLREKQEIERKRLYRLKQKELEKTEILDLSDIEATAVIPTISLKNFKKENNTKKNKAEIKKEPIIIEDSKPKSKSSFFEEYSRKIQEQRAKKEELKKIELEKQQTITKHKNEAKEVETKKKELEQKAKKPSWLDKYKEEQKKKAALKEEQRKAGIIEREKLEAQKVAEAERQKEEAEALRKEKEAEIKKRELEQKAKEPSWLDKYREEQKKKAALKEEQRKLEIIEREKLETQKMAEKKREREEAEALKEEKIFKKQQENGLNKEAGMTLAGEKEEKRLQKQAEIARIKEEKERIKKAKEEEKIARLKEKFEQQAREKKEKEDKALLIIREQQEKKKRIEKEQEQAREERREKARLIQQAREESKAKEKKERKTIEEKIKDWYDNLSFVKDTRNRRELQRQTLLIDYESAEAVRSEEKIMYKYVAKNKETEKVETGIFSAFSKLDVLSFLIAEGYEVYEIKPQVNIGINIKLFSTKFKPSDLDFFLTQLSTFLKSGITLVESVKVLSKQCKDKGQKQVYKAVIYELTMGENFSSALEKQGNVFPRLLVNMVKTSELTGDLPETLDDMANYYTEMEKTRKQMISAITYPVVILCFALTILVFIMVVVIPQFVTIYGDIGTELPSITVAVINISNFLQHNWPYVLIGVAAFILAFIIIFKSIKVFRAVIQTLLMNLPVVGKIIIYNEITMFTKTFGSLLNHNVYITDAMEVLSKITNNEVYKMLIFDTITNLAKGEAISNSFKNHWAFPTVAFEMILTGEKTGQLGTMMNKVADYYQTQHKNAVNQIKAFIEPVMIVMLASVVGVILLSVVLPMFDMYQNIG